MKCKKDCAGECDSNTPWEERSLCRMKQGADLMAQKNGGGANKKMVQDGTPEKKMGDE